MELDSRSNVILVFTLAGQTSLNVGYETVTSTGKRPAVVGIKENTVVTALVVGNVTVILLGWE